MADAARHENATVTSYFLLSSVSSREKRGGGQYLALTLTDRTGSFDARMWEEFADILQTCSCGCYVKAQGRVEKYNGRYQITLQKLRHAATTEVEPADFQPATRYDVEEMWAELVGYVDGFQNRDLHRLVMSFLDDAELAAAFRSAPAAKMLHHAWLGGLLEHVVFLLRLCRRVAPQYPDEVDPDLLMTGAILHDIGKVRELAWTSSFHYTTEGQLLGHITIAIGMVREKAAALAGFPERLRILVEHLILSHHGRFEFGSPKLPMTPEAVVFSALDDLEAKMQNMRAEFARSMESGKGADEVTEYSRSMERALLNSRAYLQEGQPLLAAVGAEPTEIQTAASAPTSAADASVDGAAEQAPAHASGQAQLANAKDENAPGQAPQAGVVALHFGE